VTGGTHRIRKSITEAGYEASCTCGWHRRRQTALLRDRLVDVHQLESLAEDAADELAQKIEGT
jgi:hypothetical protein